MMALSAQRLGHQVRCVPFMVLEPMVWVLNGAAGWGLSYSAMAKKKATEYTGTQWLLDVFGGTSGGRTHDKRIKSPLLYQLSYGPTRSLEL